MRLFIIPNETNRYCTLVHFILVIGCLLIPIMSFGATVEDVKILSITYSEDNIELKLRGKEAPQESYFFIDIVKSDPEAFHKLVHVINALMQKDHYRLDLDIMSFSVTPSGSYYRSDGIQFHGGPTKR